MVLPVINEKCMVNSVNIRITFQEIQAQGFAKKSTEFFKKL